MTLVAAGLAIALTAIAVLHAYWGAGGVWPGHDAQSCARTVVGAKGITAMPSPAACFAVAIAILLIVVALLAQIGAISLPSPAWLTGLVLIGSAAVFLLRGVAGFVPAFQRLSPEEPFATLDRRYYSPLCLLLGAAVLAVALGGAS